MKLKGVVLQLPVLWLPVSVMHMILKMTATGGLAGVDSITIQQRQKVKPGRITKAGDSYLRTLLVQELVQY